MLSDEPVMLSVFDHSGVMAQPWADAGYTCYCVDIQHTKGETREGNIVKVGADVMRWRPPQADIRFAAFFPPCTDLAVSGARWFTDKGLWSLYDAVGLFAASVEIAESLECPWFIENPVSTISTYWRKPDYTFNPCDYGDPWTKKTCLWTSADFVMPPMNKVTATEGSKMHRLPPSKVRANQRSETPPGFAKAVFQSNCPEAQPC